MPLLGLGVGLGAPPRTLMVGGDRALGASAGGGLLALIPGGLQRSIDETATSKKVVTGRMRATASRSGRDNSGISKNKTGTENTVCYEFCRFLPRRTSKRASMV